MEEFREVEGYEGLYWVSNLGNVKSKRGLKKASFNSNGYLQVTLLNKNKRATITVHKLVAKAFLDNPNNLPQINHKDEDKTNNCVENLEWCTQEYNNKYGTRKERIAIVNRNSPSQSKSVLQFDKEGNFIKEWPSIHEVSRELDFERIGISRCCNGKQKTAYGFVWKFKINNTEMCTSQTSSCLSEESLSYKWQVMKAQRTSFCCRFHRSKRMKSAIVQLAASHDSKSTWISRC